jgi:hypothetical protein
MKTVTLSRSLPILLFIACCFLLALMMQGCSGSGDEGGHSGTPASTSPASGTVKPPAAKPSGAAPVSSGKGAKADWTILFYFGADCDLEYSMLENMRQMLAVGGSDKVNIIVLADRSPNGDEEEGYSNDGVANMKNWKTAKLFSVRKKKLVELADWGPQNLGDPKVFERFLEYGEKNYPAAKTALLFSDHGAGWIGVNADENPDSDILTLPGIQSVLARITKKYGMLELIGFDACLMSNLEVAQAIAPYGRIMVASEEVEPCDGWSFTPVLKALIAQPTMDGAAIGKIIVENYRDYFKKSDDRDVRKVGRSITLSVLSLDKIDEVCTSLNGFITALMGVMKEGYKKGWKSVAKARSATEEYGADSDPADSFSVLDLHHFASLCAEYVKNDSVKKAAEALMASIDNAVLFSIHGSLRPDSHGISIYYPPSRKIYREAEGYKELSFSKKVAWDSFLEGYMRGISPRRRSGRMASFNASGKSISKGKSVTFTSSGGDEIDKAFFSLIRQEGSEKIVAGQVPATVSEDGTLSYDWDGYWFTIEDKDQSLVCPVTSYELVDSKSQQYIVIVPAKVQLKKSKKWLDVTLRFEYNGAGAKKSGSLVSVFQETKFGPREVVLKNVKAIRPVYVVVDKDGNEKRVASKDKEDMLKVDDPSSIVVGWRKLPKGDYEVGFRVIDFSGNETSDFSKITLK